MARRRRKKGSRGRLGKRILVRSLVGIVAVLVIGAVGGYLSLRAYLHSGDFREFLSELVGKGLHSEVALEPFRWDGLQVHCGGIETEGQEMVRKMRASSVQTEVGLGGVSRGVWKLRGARVRKLELELGSGEAPSFGGSASSSGWLPRKVELEDLQVEEAVLSGRVGESVFAARGQSWLVKPGLAGGEFDFAARGGTIDHPWWWFPDPELVSAKLRVQRSRLYLTDAEAMVYGEGRLYVTGEAAFDDDVYTFEGSVRGVRGERILPEDWKKRLTGDLGADFTVSGRDGRLTVNGKIGMKDGVLTALPMLDRLAAYADTARFRVLNLNVARVDFFVDGDRLRLTNVKIGTDGLMRIEGRMDVIGEQLDGRFQLGLAPGTLARIPGAESKVFVERRDGLMWAPLRITGTAENPQEDLSERLIAAAGERMFEMIPETGVKVLKFTRNAFGGGAGEVVKQAPGAIGDGIGVIRDVGSGLFNLLPGGGGGAGETVAEPERKPRISTARDLVDPIEPDVPRDVPKVPKEEEEKPPY